MSNRKAIIGFVADAGKIALHTSNASQIVVRKIAEYAAKQNWVLMVGAKDGGILGSVWDNWKLSSRILVMNESVPDKLTLPSADDNDGGSLILHPLLSHGRNYITACAPDVLIAMEGRAGTLSEICLAIKLQTPIIRLGYWDDTMLPEALIDRPKGPFLFIDIPRDNSRNEEIEIAAALTILAIEKLLPARLAHRLYFPRHFRSDDNAAKSQSVLQSKHLRLVFRRKTSKSFLHHVSCSFERAFCAATL